MMLLSKKAVLLLVGLLAGLGGPASAQRMALVWSDEFDGAGLDRAVWTPWVGTAFNQEAQYYRTENAFVADGLLHLEARRELYQGRSFTSARVESWPYRGQGADGHAWTYGRFEVRAKMPPATDGLWPALWMMPARPAYGSWPYSGEIDIMEWRSHIPAAMQGTIHYSCCRHPGSGNALADRRSQHGTYTLPAGTFSDDFHTFAVEWDEEGISWYVDSLRFHHVARAQIGAEVYPFNRPFYFILNLAVGGNFIEHRLPPADFTSAALLVDYVRVYQDVNQAPRAALQGLPAVLPPFETIRLRADAADDDGTVMQVDFFVDTTRVATDTEAPFEVDWRVPTEGCYRLSVRARDNDGGLSPPGPDVPLTVGAGCVQRPFGETPLVLPGTLRAADYDRGGQGVGYFDTTPLANLGEPGPAGYRPTEGVDLAPAVDGSGTFDVAFVELGEWLAYTVDVPQGGLFDVTLEARPAVTNARVLLELDGAYLTRLVRLNPPADSTAYAASTATGVAIPAGRHILRVTPERAGTTLHALRFDLRSGTRAEASAPAAGAVVLGQNYPNPFAAATEIPFTLPAPAHVTLALYDVLGRQVAVLASGYHPAGTHRVTLPHGDLAAGLYTYVLTADGVRTARRLHVLPE